MNELESPSFQPWGGRQEDGGADAEHRQHGRGALGLNRVRNRHHDRRDRNHGQQVEAQFPRHQRGDFHRTGATDRPDHRPPTPSDSLTKVQSSCSSSTMSGMLTFSRRNAR